jgi:hypothetical protein
MLEAPNMSKTGKPRARPEKRSKADQSPQPAAQYAPRPHAGYDTERAAYARLKTGLLETALGRFVVLVGNDLAGPFDDFPTAYVAGRRRFGPGPLYIKQILADEPVFEPVSLEPCPS